MSLVAAYGSSSDEESDPEVDSSTSKVEIKATFTNNPSSAIRKTNLVGEEEEDDEFVHKKVDQSLIERPKNDKKDGTKGKVKIMIPSLSSFQDDENDSNRTVNKPKGKLNGLLGMLPPPKSGISFLKIEDTNDSSEGTKKSVKATVTSLVPDTVRNRKPPPAATRTSKPKKIVDADEMADEQEEDEGTSGDFFGVFKEESVPLVNNEEIAALIQKRAERMKAIEEAQSSSTTNDMQWETSESSAVPQYQSSQPADIEALIGRKGTKRKRKEDIQFIDISQDQLTNKEEWMNHSLQAETEYQPRGLISDVGTGTKKKHQITYLAQQAKVNEQELQSMWSANRHAKMQTQSKYGF